MGKVQSLVSLCIEELERELVNGDDILPDMYELPPELFDCLMTRLPPLALQKFQNEMPFKDLDDYQSDGASSKNGRKRGRKGNFDAAWKALFKSRWPELVDNIQPDDWQQMYWETHLQNCLDEAAEVAVLPSFNGCISEIKISETTLEHLDRSGDINNSTSGYSKLSYHFQHFGYYARCLRLQNVLCVAETSQLLRSSKLQSLVLRWIRSEEHVEGLCKLLVQNRETLITLEFSHCKLSSNFVNAIFDSLCIASSKAHRIQHFSVNTSSFLETNLVSLPPGLVSFLTLGRSLSSLKFCNDHLDWKFARIIWSTLLDVSSSLSILDLSENNIAGWLSSFNWRFSSDSLSVLGVSKSLHSLRLLNLRYHVITDKFFIFV